ncbi:MAG: IMP dehydrogenase [Firmicutes bacterium]|nr:IMP dehydrogenase [Alicyclobacillaceae bacterium]MCL6496254.1 IMP dehydrogenase [Bacillota bacterium]
MSPWLPLAALVAAGTGGGLFAAGVRRMLAREERRLGDPPENTWTEALFTLDAMSLPDLLLTLQRAQRGAAAEHPMGSPEARPWFDRIGFDPATLRPPPRPRPDPDVLATTLGPRAARPLTLRLPVLVAPMGWGIGLQAEAKVALAQAAALAGTAVVSGEGPYLPEERAAAWRWVLQWSRGPWAHQAAVVRLADMVEIQWSQGSEGGVGIAKPAPSLEGRVARALPAGVRRARLRPAHGALAQTLRHIRALNPEVPVGVKIAASDHLEEDLEVLAGLGVDVVTIDGREAGSAGSPAVLSDRFGLPTVLAVARAARWRARAGLVGRLSLVASGGVRDAADIAILLALGADAVAVGSVLLLALTHNQVARHAPEPPTALILARPRGQQTLDINQATEHAFRWFCATAEELTTILAALGLERPDQLGPNHLRAEDPKVAKALGIASLAAAPPYGPADKLGQLVAEYDRLNRILRQHLERLAYAEGSPLPGRAQRSEATPWSGVKP